MYNYYYNVATEQPVKMKASETASGEVRYDLITITEEQYNELLIGVVSGKKYFNNGIHVFEAPTPTRAPKWFEVVKYSLENNTPTTTIVKRSLESIRDQVASVRRDRLNNSIYSDREYNAFREMVDSGLPVSIYIDKNGVGTPYTLEQSRTKLQEIAAFRQLQFIIENSYVSAYDLGYTIPDPSISGNWDIDVITGITNKPVKGKKGNK